MKTDELAKRILLPREAYTAVVKVEISREEYVRERELFYQDIKSFLERWKGKEKRYIWALAFYLRLSAETYDKYQEEGIPDQVFDQTFYDLTIWCRECYRKYGVYGLEELWWLGQSVKMKLFRLGRLQFEPIRVKEPLEGNGIRIKAGTKGLNVHIPEDGPLKYEACIESFRQAELFFADREGDRPEFYMCDSWLLSPALEELLPKTSNIIRFQKLFRIVKVHYTFPQAEQRIFGEVLEDKSGYPENTSLQKKAKAYILEGKDPGIGVGVIDDVYRYM